MADTTLKIADLEAQACYKLLTAIIVPRPIAFVSTVSEAGLVNAAPYSFFNMFAEAPPTIVLGLHWRPDTTLKDTTANIRRTGEFVVNLVDEALAQAMSDAAIDFPPGVSETDALGIEMAPSTLVKAPRIKAAPFALECRKLVGRSFSAERELLLGEIVAVHARDGLLDPIRLRVSPDYHPVGRLHGNLYARRRDRFELNRPSYADWAKANGKAPEKP